MAITLYLYGIDSPKIKWYLISTIIQFAGSNMFWYHRVGFGFVERFQRQDLKNLKKY